MAWGALRGLGGQGGDELVDDASGGLVRGVDNAVSELPRDAFDRVRWVAPGHTGEAGDVLTSKPGAPGV